MADRRGMVIHFMDGTRVSFDFPQQMKDTTNMTTRIERILEQKYVIVEAEGAVLLYPVANIKSIQLFPAPDALPDFVVKGATVRE